MMKSQPPSRTPYTRIAIEIKTYTMKDASLSGLFGGWLTRLSKFPVYGYDPPGAQPRQGRARPGASRAAAANGGVAAPMPVAGSFLPFPLVMLADALVDRAYLQDRLSKAPG